MSQTTENIKLTTKQAIEVAFLMEVNRHKWDWVHSIEDRIKDRLNADKVRLSDAHEGERRAWVFLEGKLYEVWLQMPSALGLPDESLSFNQRRFFHGWIVDTIKNTGLM